MFGGCFETNALAHPTRLPWPWWFILPTGRRARRFRPIAANKRLVLVAAATLRYHIFGQIVRTAGPEHELIHAHAHVLALGFDAFPYEHAGTVDAVHRAGLRVDLVVVTRTGGHTGQTRHRWRTLSNPTECG